jgi:hypothetical protein
MTMLSSVIGFLNDKGTKGRQIAEGLIADQDRERLETRAALVAERGDITARELKKSLARDAARTAEETQIAQLRAGVEESILASQRNEAAHRLDVMLLESRRTQLDAALAVSASPLIDAFIADLRNIDLLATYASRDDVTVPNVTGERNVAWTNLRSVGLRAEAIRAAILDAQSWYLEALSDDDIVERCDRVRTNFPHVENRPRKYQFGIDDAA